jgi:hypothetical protein
MGQIDWIAPLVFALVLAMLLFQRGFREAVIEAIDRFRGGPRTPMHPSPAGDVAHLRKPQKTVRFRLSALVAIE